MKFDINLGVKNVDKVQVTQNVTSISRPIKPNDVSTILLNNYSLKNFSETKAVLRGN